MSEEQKAELEKQKRDKEIKVIKEGRKDFDKYLKKREKFSRINKQYEYDVRRFAKNDQFEEMDEEELLAQ